MPSQGGERSPEPAAVAAVLADARRRLRTISGVWVATSLAGAAAVALLSGALVLALDGGAGWAALTQIGTLALIVLPLLWFARAARRTAGSDLHLADRIDRSIAKDGPTDTLRSAVELARDRGRYGESESLAGWGARRAVTQAIDNRAVERWSERVRRYRLRFSAVCAASVLGAGTLAVVAPDLWVRSAGALGSLDEVREVLEQIPPEPRLGDIRLTYRYPDYAGRAPRTVTTPSGRIRALPGTEVEIETQARREISEASLLVSHGSGDGAPERVAVEATGRQLRARLVANRSGRYRFSLITADGTLHEERRGHAIEIEIDAPPTVKLLRPETSPLEVNERDRVPLTFEAEDDFALGEASVAWRVLRSDREGRVRLTRAAAGLSRYKGTAQLDLEPLGLVPGDRVAYTVEVRDNDTVNGPKAGSSRTQELRVYSKRAHHQQVLAMQEKALDELVHILGDNLDHAFRSVSDRVIHGRVMETARDIIRRAENANALLRETIVAIRNDPLGKPQVAAAFEQARRDLRRDTRRKHRAVEEAARDFARGRTTHRSARPVVRSQNRMVARLEKNAVYLADLLNDQRLRDAESLAKELRTQQQALRKAIEQYRKAPHDAARAAIRKAIEDIKAKIAATLSELSRLQSAIPQGFMNEDALRGPEQTREMDAIERMVEEGDLDAAMEQLDRLLGQTERLLAGLQEGRQALGSREYSEIAERAARIYQNLTELERQERRLASQTESLSRRALERMRNRVGDEDAFVKRQVKRLEMVQQTLEEGRPDSFMPEQELFELTERRIDDGRRALESRDFGEARGMLERSQSQMEQLRTESRRRADHARRFGDLFGIQDRSGRSRRALRKAQPVVEAVLEELARLMPDPASLLSPEERQHVSKLAGRQREIEGQADQLHRDLSELGEQLPIVGPEIPQMLEGARASMQAAERRLQAGDAPGGLGRERAALEKLAQLRQELDQMGDRQGGGGQGVPLPFGQSRGSGQSPGHDGQDPGSREKVAIPKPEEYQAPAEFREDILEAAKQGTVESYREAVRRYYEELVR